MINLDQSEQPNLRLKVMCPKTKSCVPSSPPQFLSVFHPEDAWIWAYKPGLQIEIQLLCQPSVPPNTNHHIMKATNQGSF